jgi:hypothetical protein
MSDFRLPAPSRNSVASESFIAYTMPSTLGAPITYLIYERSKPLPPWRHSEEASVLSFTVDSNRSLISGIRHGENSPETIASGLEFARQYFNTEGGLPISLAPRARYWQHRYPPWVGEIVARFDGFRGSESLISPERKLVGRRQAAKTVQTRFYDCFDHFVLSRGNSLPGGRQSVLVPFDGHRAKSYDEAKRQLLQVIWEHTKDSSESDDAQLLDQLAMDMECIVTWVLHYIAERHHHHPPPQSRYDPQHVLMGIAGYYGSEELD